MISPVSKVANEIAGDGLRPGGYTRFAASAGALGGLLFGYDWVVIGGAKPFYEVFSISIRLLCRAGR